MRVRVRASSLGLTNPVVNAHRIGKPERCRHFLYDNHPTNEDDDAPEQRTDCSATGPGDRCTKGGEINEPPDGEPRKGFLPTEAGLWE